MKLNDDLAKSSKQWMINATKTQQVSTRKGELLLKSIENILISHRIIFCQKKEARIKSILCYIRSDQDETTIQIAQLRSSYYSYEL